MPGPDPPLKDEPDRLREIPRWAKRYADSRVLPAVIAASLYGLIMGILLAGAPLYFRSSHPFQNIWLSGLSCMVLTLIFAHLYNRYALHGLRRLSLSPEAPSKEADPYA